MGEELLVSSSIVLTFFTVVYSSLGFPIIQWFGQMNMDAIGEGEEQGSASWVWVWSSLDFSKPSPTTGIHIFSSVHSSSTCV